MRVPVASMPVNAPKNAPKIFGLGTSSRLATDHQVEAHGPAPPDPGGRVSSGTQSSTSALTLEA
jgi:hypothetical protein